MSGGSSKRATAFGTVGFMIGAVVFAAVAGVLVSQLLENRYSREPLREVVVVKRDLPAGEPLRAEDLSCLDWPRSAVPRGAFSRVQAVVRANRVPLVPLVKGQPVLLSQLSKRNTGIGVASLIEAGKRAMAIETDNSVTLARLVYPGARVDVLSTSQRQDARRGTRMVTRTVLQNVKVLAVGEDIDPLTVARRRKGGGGEGAPFSGRQSDAREAGKVITLMVAPGETEALSRAQRQGKIDIALRNPSDSGVHSLGEAEGGPGGDGWGMTLTQKDEAPKAAGTDKKKTTRKRRRGPGLTVASREPPRIRIVRGGKH